MLFIENLINGTPCGEIHCHKGARIEYWLHAQHNEERAKQVTQYPAKAWRIPVAAVDDGVWQPLKFVVRLTDVQQIGNELALKWDDGMESFIALEKLRRACPCAGCKGETDVMGNLYIAPPKPLRPESFQLKGLAHVGGYAIQPQWADGHSTGLYSFDYLRRLAE